MTTFYYIYVNYAVPLVFLLYVGLHIFHQKKDTAKMTTFYLFYIVDAVSLDV